MKWPDLNKEQRKHIASFIDKAAIGFFVVFGYTAWTREDFVSVALSSIVALCLEVAAVLILEEKGVQK